MKRYNKWATAGVALTIMGVLAGCGIGGGVSSRPTPAPNVSNTVSNATNNTNAIASSNNVLTNRTPTTNNTTTHTSTPPTNTVTTHTTSNTTGSTPSSAVPAMVLVSLPLTNVQSIGFNAPSGWTKQKVVQGDSSGYAWVNPNDNNQQIQVISSGNMSAIQNYQTKQWDVTGIFGYGNKGITWTNIASDKLTANFTDATGTNFFSKNEKTTNTGYGKAFIVQRPHPFSVYVEVWGTQNLANAVLSTVQLQQ